MDSCTRHCGGGTQTVHSLYLKVKQMEELVKQNKTESRSCTQCCKQDCEGLD